MANITETIPHHDTEPATECRLPRRPDFPKELAEACVWGALDMTEEHLITAINDMFQVHLDHYTDASEDLPMDFDLSAFVKLIGSVRNQVIPIAQTAARAFVDDMSATAITNLNGAASAAPT